jgi:ERF superfamily protein
MPRSSESVAALASALAKAQAELANPEKSLTATIRSGRPGEGERSFRYAPLASGLDIVRKTLGKYEIATVQTTAIEPAAGMVNLTTMLAHASGEWIASDWPVCPVAEIAHPQRMGAALTYARRYALFTLVGIAGEDDLDAPDLCDPAPPGSPTFTDDPASTPREQRLPRRPMGNGHGRSATRAEPRVVPDADQSAALRSRLLTEIGDISSTEHAAGWARAALSAKNSLSASDARLVEDAFEQRLSQLGSSSETATSSDDDGSKPEVAVVRPQPPANPETADKSLAQGIDKSALAVPAPRRYRDRDHLRHVAKQPCLICGRKPSDPHHLRYLQPRALGRKSSDEFVVPLCRIHHRLVHRVGNEPAWWQDAGIDPITAARKLWNETRSDAGRPAPAAQAHGTAIDQPLTAEGLSADRPAPV